MAAAWHTTLSFEPPLYGVSISPKRATYKLITDSREFGINFLPFSAAELIAAVGGSDGRYIDKFEEFKIAAEKPRRTSVPVLKLAYCAYECHVVDDHEYGDHRLIVGRIVAVHLLKEAFTPEGVLDIAKTSPALYLGAEQYLDAGGAPVKRLEREKYGKKETP